MRSSAPSGPGSGAGRPARSACWTPFSSRKKRTASPLPASRRKGSCGSSWRSSRATNGAPAPAEDAAANEEPGPATFAEAVAGQDLVVTTYPLALRDEETLRSVAWDTVILDEAQNIKNPGARQTRAVRALAAPRRIAMTGTPVENRLSDLWSIMEFLNPGFLGPERAFRGRYAIPIERDRDPEAAERLRRLTKPFIL